MYERCFGVELPLREGAIWRRLGWAGLGIGRLLIHTKPAEEDAAY